MAMTTSVVSIPDPDVVGRSSRTTIASTPGSDPEAPVAGAAQDGDLAARALLDQVRRPLVRRGFSAAQTAARLLHMISLGILTTEWFNLAGDGWPWDSGAPQAFLPGCNVPLNLWALVLIAFGILSVIKFFYCSFGWPSEYERLEEAPTWMKALELMYQLVLAVWALLGLNWVSCADGECVWRHGTFLRAVVGFCCMHVVLVVMIYINVFCLGIVFRPQAKTSPWSPPVGLLERSTRPVATSDLPAGFCTCPICLDNLDDELPIVVIRTCEHAFHTQCLQEWIDRHDEHVKCPLCRQDLLAGQAE